MNINPKNFDYEAAVYEDIPCNFCGEKFNFDVIAEIDRTGLNTRTCLCQKCGLIFISPRMTKDFYDLYYRQEYRGQMQRVHKGVGQLDLAGQFAAGEKFGYGVAEVVAPYLKDGLTIDIGSGVGGVLMGLKKFKNSLEIMGIEPSTAESEYANQQGIKTYTTLFENFHEDLPPMANILSTRNLNHLLDPKAFLIWAYNQLAPDGRLILVVQNFRLSAKRLGRIVPQIDHVYMFLPETLCAFVEAAGFEILLFDNPEEKSYKQVREDKKRNITAHMKLVAKKTNRAPFQNVSLSPNLYLHTKRSMHPVSIKLCYWWYRLDMLSRHFLARWMKKN